MFYTVYKTTNTLNGRVYIGVHKTNNPNDTYKGSGKIIKQAFKLYGKENFVKEVLFIYDSEEEAYAKEKELVDSDFISREDTYNVVGGGSVSASWVEERKAKVRSKPGFMSGRKHSEETKRRIALAGTGRKHSEESRQLMSQRQKERPLDQCARGFKWSKASKDQLSQSRKNLPKVKCPHCEKVTDSGNAGRWHFDKCKHNPNRLKEN